jgi:hypothetical protein
VPAGQTLEKVARAGQAYPAAQVPHSLALTRRVLPSHTHTISVMTHADYNAIHPEITMQKNRATE